MITPANERPAYLIDGNNQLWAFEVEVDQGRITRIIPHWPEYLSEMPDDQLDGLARLVATERARRDEMPVVQPDMDEGINYG